MRQRVVPGFEHEVAIHVNAMQRADGLESQPVRAIERPRHARAVERREHPALDALELDDPGAAQRDVVVVGRVGAARREPHPAIVAVDRGRLHVRLNRLAGPVIRVEYRAGIAGRAGLAEHARIAALNHRELAARQRGPPKTVAGGERILEQRRLREAFRQLEVVRPVPAAHEHTASAHRNRCVQIVCRPLRRGSRRAGRSRSRPAGTRSPRPRHDRRSSASLEHVLVRFDDRVAVRCSRR